MYNQLLICLFFWVCMAGHVTYCRHLHGDFVASTSFKIGFYVLFWTTFAALFDLLVQIYVFNS